MAQPSSSAGVSSFVQALGKVTGAFSLVLMSEQEIVGVRDSARLSPAVHRQGGRRVDALQRKLRVRDDAGSEVRPRC